MAATPEEIQKYARSVGLCGHLDGGRGVCILPADHGQHGSVQDIARAYFEANEWSGCAGADWDRLTLERRSALIRETMKWCAAIHAGGAKIVPR